MVNFFLWVNIRVNIKLFKEIVYMYIKFRGNTQDFRINFYYYLCLGYNCPVN